MDKLVDQSPGDGYSKWIHLAKQKLLLRENALLEIRVDKANSIVNQVWFNLIAFSLSKESVLSFCRIVISSGYTMCFGQNCK